jgi:hypothetical protein
MPGQRVQDRRFQQMDGQPQLVQPGAQQMGQDIGPVCRDARAVDVRVEHAPDAGDRALDPDPPGHRGNQMRAAD